MQEAGSRNLAVRPERRRQYLGELDAYVPDVLNLLAMCLSDAASQLQIEILQAFAAWLRVGYG
eukprot:jgi/Mesen1/2156/ME000152S01248